LRDTYKHNIKIFPVLCESMVDYDAVIVGAGPAGLTLASELGRKHRVLVIEEHQKIGRPMQCAGLVSPRVMEITKLTDCVCAKFNGAVLLSPSFKPFHFFSTVIKAYAIDREKFDEKLGYKCIKRADVFLNTKFIDAKRKGNEVVVRLQEGKAEKELTTRVLVGADGVVSKVRKIFGFQEPEEYISTYGAEVKNLALDTIEIYTGQRFAPGFFGWAIPCGDVVRLGVGSASGHAKMHFEELVSAIERRKGVKLTRTKTITGAIPLGLLSKYARDNVVLVGDAGCQVKPVSGGGIYLGISGAIICADVLNKALESNNLSEKVLNEYSVRFLKLFKKEIKFGMHARTLLRHISDGTIEQGIEELSACASAREIIGKYGDIDYPSLLLKPLLKKCPKLVKLAFPSIGDML
jgi:geranylgeranyl reductase family protein